MSARRHFVKYTFLKVDPAWRRRDGSEREQDKRELMAACEDFADGHLLQSFSLVGTRGDAELLLIAEAENLKRIHEFHVVLAQSGLMQWALDPLLVPGHAQELGVLRRRARLAARLRGRYVFVYPFVKSREWYALPAEERWRIMQGHIEVGREYPGVDNHTTYSFGLDDQEFVVAFDTDDVGTFLDLVQRLRTTEASRYTVRDTPSFTCISDVSGAGAERARRRADRRPTELPAPAVSVPAQPQAPRPCATKAGAARRRARRARVAPASQRPRDGEADRRGRPAARPAPGDPTATITTARSCARSSASSCRCAPRARSTSA